MYYKLLQNSIKKIYDNNRYSAYNQAYSLEIKEFLTNRQSIKLLIDGGRDINWKDYLLEKMEPNQKENWKLMFHDYINKENFPNQYIFQNRIFFQEFSLISKPKSNKKEEDILSLQSEPVLSPLDNRELKSLSKSLPCIYSNQNYVDSDKDSDDDIRYNNINDDDINTNCVQHLIMNVSMESFGDTRDKTNSQHKAQSNSFMLRKYIQLIKQHLDDGRHPINVIINKFIIYFTPYLEGAKEFCEKTKENKIECMKKGKEVIKEIQYFIETMQVVVKLFYSKSINYEYFVEEKDEIINLISYILFNKKSIYTLLYKIFYYMNYENISKISSQFRKIGELTPTDLGIAPKFCLDKTTDELMKQLKENKNKKNNIDKGNELIEEKKSSKKLNKIVQFIELNDDKNKNSKEDLFNFDDFEINIYSKNDNLTERSFIDNINNKQYNSFVLNDEDKNMSSTRTIEDFQKNIESFGYEMDIKDILLNDINNKFFLSLPKMTEYNEIPISKEPYLYAINYLRQIDTYKVPLEKFTVIALISVIITNCVDKYWGVMKDDLEKKYLNIDADELMSIYLYIIYKLKMPTLYVHLDFIKYFTTTNSKQTIMGYYYTTLEGCLNFILDIKDKKSLLQNSS